MRPQLRFFACALAAAVLGLPRAGSAQAPNPVSAEYEFPTAAQRFTGLGRDIAGPLALIQIAGSAGVSHATDSPREWDGARGFGRRLGSAVGQTIAAEATAYGLAEVFREDTRFQLSTRRGFLPRFGDAVVGSVTARRRDGRRVFSGARVGGFVASGTVRLLWYPDRYGARDGLMFAASSAASSAFVNVIREFVIRK